MSEVDSAPNAPCIQVLSAILHDIGASEYTSKFTGDDQDDESIIAFSVTKPHKIANKYGLSLKLATAFVDKCCIAVDAEELASAFEHIEKCRLSPAAQQQSTALITAALSRLNFHIISELGKGAFGTVFKCKSRTDKRTVAVKIVNDPKNSKEALREGQRLVNCRHPNIVCMHKVHDIGKAMCALEMEVISGGDLLQHLEAARQRPERRLPKDVVIRFSRQLLDVLYYLHERSQMRMLHGDIKPQNILVTCKHPPANDSPTDYTDADIKIADFGLAKTTSSPANTSMSLFMTNASTKAGMFKGTMWYMSPEALQGISQGRERCFADDLWSACLVILEMDTGLTLQQLMTAPGAVNMDEMLTNASVHLLPLFFSVFSPGPSSRGSSAKDLLRILDDSLNPLFEWTFFETSTSNFVPVHPAVAFALEECFASCQPRTSLSLKPPLDLNFDISPMLKSATAMGIQTQRSTGSVVVIRRTLKSSVLTSGTPILVWQELIGAREWLQCDPSTCAKLDIDIRNTSALPDPLRFRRVILQPSSIDNVQIPLPLKSEPYLHSAQAADIACMTARIHDSLPEWDILEMLQIINPTLQSKYADYRHRAAARSNGNPNERMLFHFAPDFVIPKIWQEGEGHDPRLSNWAEVGKGSYFSEHLIYGYAYNFKLWPSPSSNYMAEADPECGTTFRVFATLVCLGNIADMGPGCETCPSDTWNAWKREFVYQKSPDNPSPKPTRPPIMPLPQDEAHKQHLLNLMQVKDAPRCDSIVSTEGDLATHSASTNKAPSGKLICDIMHPRLKMRAREWGQQYVVFDTAASYPMFLITLKKTRESPKVYEDGSMSCDDLICSEAPFSAERNLFVSNCPDLSTDQLHSKLQGLNIVSMQSLTLRNSGVDDCVLDFCCRRFRSLTSLDVSDNSALVSIPPSISMLTELRHLGVSKCVSLQSLPDELPQSLNVINARDCPSIYFPPNFIVQQGCNKILQFMKDARKSKPVRRVKVLFLGDPRSGKTSFLQALAKLPLKPGDMGPDESLDLEERLKSDSMDLFLQNVPELCFFDFSRDVPINAALDIISFHRQTVFVICFSVMEDNPQSQVVKWLEMIASSRICMQQVRIVIVGTKIDLIEPQSRSERKNRIANILYTHICAIFHDHFDARSTVTVMFVTSIQTDTHYSDLRREFKRHVITLSKSIFEGSHAFRLRVPDIYKDVLDSVDALKKRVKPGMANVFQLQNMVNLTLYGQLAGAHKDSLKLDALKMLHDMGELVFVDSDTLPCIILKPQLMFRIFSTFFDPVCKFAKVLSREAIRITLQTMCMHQAAEVSETLFDFLLKLRVFSEVKSCTNAAFQPELKSFMISVSNNTRPLPNSWAEVLSSRSASCIRGLRVFSEKGIISFSNFNNAMKQLCVEPSFMWAFAFCYLLDNGTACFVRQAEQRSFVDIIFLSNDVSNISGVTVDAAYRRVVQLLSFYPLPPLPLCPYCCASNSFVRFGEAHICYEKELQDPLHCIQNREAGTESAQAKHAVHGSSITIYCSRNHQFSGSHALTGLNVGSSGVGKHVTFPTPIGESAERDALGWISVSNLGLANTPTGMFEVMPGSFFSVSRQLREGDAINLKSLTTIEDALRSGAETCSVRRFGATVGEESSDLVVRLKFSVGDSIRDEVIDMVLSCSGMVEVKTFDVSKCSVITKQPHKLSRGDEVILSVSVDSDGSKVSGVLCLVANVIDNDHLVLERKHPQSAAPLPLHADVRIIPICASFTPFDNVLVVYKGSGSGKRLKFDLFPGSSNNFEILRIVSSDCFRATEAACWRDVEDNWVTMLGNDSCNFEITGMTLLRCREREQLFLEEVNHLRSIAPLRPQPDFKCPFDQSDLEKEKRAALQQQVIGHFSEFSQKFSVWPQEECKDVNVCAAWVGLWDADAVYYNNAQNGFWNLPPHLKIDPGFFGEGFYLSRCPRYTDYYVNDFSLSRRKVERASQLMCYVALGRPYPVTQDPFVLPFYTKSLPSPSSLCGKSCGAACNFSSADGIDSHDCHYATVSLHPHGAQYFPCPLGKQPDFDEIVIFNSKRILASAIIHYQRRYKTLLWLDDNPNYPENQRVCRGIPGHHASKPTRLPGSCDGQIFLEADNCHISLTDQVDVFLFLHVEALTEYLSSPSHTKFAKYPKSLFRIICNERMLVPLLQFLDSSSIFAGSFPAICVTGNQGIAALPHSFLQEYRRPNLMICTDSVFLQLFALFEPLPNIM